MARHLALFLFLLSARGAWADGSSDAEDLVRQAVQLRREGKDQAAFKLLREAYDLRPTARTAAQLGLVEMALNYWVEAEAHLGEGLASRENQWIEANRETLAGALREVQRHIAHVKISGGPDGSNVSVNGRVVGNTPLSLPLPVAAGRVELTVQSADGETWSQTLVLEGASTVTVSVMLGSKSEVAPATRASSQENPPVPTAPPSPPPPSSAGSSRRTLALIAGIASIAALGGAGIFAKLADDDRRAFDGLENAIGTERPCGARDLDRGSDPRCQSLYDAWHRERLLTFVGLGAAAALLVTGGVFYVTREEKESTRLGMRCSATVASVGAQCGGWF